MRERNRGRRGRSGDPGAPPDDCARIRDVLPLHMAGTPPEGRAGEVEAHLEGCPECRREAAFLGRLHAARPVPPPDLIPSVVRRVAAARVASGREAGPRRPVFRQWVGWAVPAAAGLLLALGLGLLRNGDPFPDPGWTLALEPDSEVWYEEEWMVAGEPLLEGLPDEVLMALLEEVDR